MGGDELRRPSARWFGSGRLTSVAGRRDDPQNLELAIALCGLGALVGYGPIRRIRHFEVSSGLRIRESSALRFLCKAADQV